MKLLLLIRKGTVSLRCVPVVVALPFATKAFSPFSMWPSSVTCPPPSMCHRSSIDPATNEKTHREARSRRGPVCAGLQGIDGGRTEARLHPDLLRTCGGTRLQRENLLGKRKGYHGSTRSMQTTKSVRACFCGGDSRCRGLRGNLDRSHPRGGDTGCYSDDAPAPSPTAVELGLA